MRGLPRTREASGRTIERDSRGLAAGKFLPTFVSLAMRILLLSVTNVQAMLLLLAQRIIGVVYLFSLCR